MIVDKTTKEKDLRIWEKKVRNKRNIGDGLATDWNFRNKYVMNGIDYLLDNISFTR
jgi:hypothetical protein